MNINRNQVKALSTLDELELFDNSRSLRLNKLTVADLKNMVKRSRGLRDKLRDLAKKQERSRQSKIGLRGTAENERSVNKAELYSEVHEAFVSRLAAVQTGEAEAKEGTVKKPARKARIIETPASPKSKKENRKMSATEPKPIGTIKNSGSAPEVADTKMAEPKKLLASAAISRMAGKPGVVASSSVESAKVTAASKAAVDKSVNEDQKSQKSSVRGKILETRFARSGMTQKRTHLSSVNKRNQARRDSK